MNLGKKQVESVLTHTVLGSEVVTCGKDKIQIDASSLLLIRRAVLS